MGYMADEQVTQPQLADEAPAQISDHAFIPRGEWYTTCGYVIHGGPEKAGRPCGLAEAAHQSGTVDRAKRD